MDLMRRAAIATACLTVALALPAAGLAAGRATAHGAPIGRCTGHRGTIVAVDFGHWGGPIVRGCALRAHTGYALLHDVGFTTAGDAHDGPGFVCRLGDAAFRGGVQYPTPAQTGCVLTPPTTGYWSYWVAPAGSDRWQDSQLGAMDDVPRAGEAQLWMFGATDVAGTRGSGVPRFSPADLRARPDGRGAAGPRLVDALAATRPASAGSAAGLVIGIGAALVLCAATGWATWRRRRDA